jgi:lycopene cyclase domain-containing protein
MNNFYLYLLLGSFSVPFLFSFHPRLNFFKRWPSFLLGVIIMMGIFIPWDIIFTHNGFWGFNELYLTGIYLINLPIEEWLFFILIPYACIFTHYSLREVFSNWGFNTDRSINFILGFTVFLIILLLFTYDRWYTFSDILYFIIIISLVLFTNRDLIGEFLPSFLVITIPFLIVNGLLTGFAIDQEVVWYNNDENLSLRFITIPLEDFVYNFSMLITVLYFETLFYKKGIKFGK